MASLAIHCGSGPDWQIVKGLSRECRTVWWKNLLYINDWMTPEIRGPSNEVTLIVHSICNTFSFCFSVRK